MTSTRTSAEPGGIRALSIQQPWAWLIVNGHKDIENRDWRCQRRGRILIHAGKKMDRECLLALCGGEHPVTGRRLAPEIFAALEAASPLPVGGIVGEATIAGCVAHSDSPWFVGKFGILVQDARPLPFRPCKGALGLFAPDFDIPAEAPPAARPVRPDLFDGGRLP